jgi:riboflavin biosynthesis pyrimidine reductase
LPARPQRSVDRGGHRLNGSLLKEALVDELLIYQAPLLLATRRAHVGLPELTALAGATRLEVIPACRRR